MSRADVLRARWTALAPRERRMVAIAATLVLLALVWWVALAPALRTLGGARAEHARLDAQLQQMNTLRAQAKALQAQPRANRDEALRALDSAVRQGLGPAAQIANAGDGANVALRGAPADALAQWLAQARSNARAVPREAHLTRAQIAAPPVQAPATGAMPGGRPRPAGPAGNTAGNADEPARVRWDGTLVMALPAGR